MSYIVEQPLVEQQKIWEAFSLKKVIEEFVTNDNRFIGYSKYVVNIRIFWSRMIDTACAGHGFIFFNPEFFDSIPVETRKTVFAHEIWHLILKHLERSKDADPDQHNIAADHVINLGLEKDGFTFEGTIPYKDKQFTGMSTEQVYNIIYKRAKKNPNRVASSNTISNEEIEDLIEVVLEDDGQHISLEEQKDKSDEDIEDLQKNIGNMPGYAHIVLSKTNQKIIIEDATYHDIFKKYLIDPLTGGQRTFMRPNRRQHGMSGSLRLPGRYPKRGHINRLTHLVYALDVSGSITKRQAQQFHDSVRTIKELLNPEKLTVLLFDTRIVHEETFTDKQDYSKITVKAGGGTCLKQVYGKVEKLQPEALVIFTDLGVEILPEPSWETIWILPDNQNYIPLDLYGEVYRIPKI